MATIAVMGAGIGGISQVYELRKALGKKHQVVLIGDSDRFEFTPSNPWVAVGWRKEKQVTVALPELMQKYGIEFSSEGVRRVHPAEKSLELNDGSFMSYDYLVIATGPKLAFDEVDGLGPNGGFTQSICKTGHANQSQTNFEKLVNNPGPVVIGIEGLCNPRGFILIDEFQRNPAYPNIYAVGVCVALPQIPPRNTNWASRGKWVHLAKIAYEKYFLHKVRAAKTEPYYEKMVLKMVGAMRLKDSA